MPLATLVLVYLNYQFLALFALNIILKPIPNSNGLRETNTGHEINIIEAALNQQFSFSIGPSDAAAEGASHSIDSVTPIPRALCNSYFIAEWIMILII
jgi:hypothetical protein